MIVFFILAILQFCKLKIVYYELMEQNEFQIRNQRTHISMHYPTKSIRTPLNIRVLIVPSID